MNTWNKRNKYLKEHGLTYSEYLKTEHWQLLKQRKLASKTKYVCFVCGCKKYLELHHKTYKRIGNERLMDVIWLCRNCHELTHRIEIPTRGSRNYNLWEASKKAKRQHKRRE